jgi:hypothetical protein
MLGDYTTMGTTLHYTDSLHSEWKHHKQFYQKSHFLGGGRLLHILLAHILTDGKRTT